MEPSPAVEAVGRAGRRAAYHLVQAMVETLKAVEVVIEEIGAIGSEIDNNVEEEDVKRHRIEVE